MKHQFTIANSSSRSSGSYTLSDITVMSVYATLSLKTRHPDLGPSERVLAIKSLRSMTGMGLYEAKQIVDFIADNARMNETTGEVYIDRPVVAVTYASLA